MNNKEHLSVISMIHINRWDKNYLCEFINNNIPRNKWNYSSNESIIAKIYLSRIMTKLCIKRNNFNLPRELWDIICTFISNEIYFYLERVITITKELNLNENSVDTRVFNIKKYFKIHESDCLVDPKEILNFIDNGSLITHQNFRGVIMSHSYTFLIVINVDRKRKIIEFFENDGFFGPWNIEEDVLKYFGKINISFYEKTFICILNFHEFVLRCKYVLKISKETKNDIEHIISNLKFETRSI